MSAAEIWELAAVVLGFFSAAVTMLSPTGPVVSRLGSAAIAAAVACVAAGLLIALP